jgi:alpha-glucoside transport system substrate-binding protein
MARLERQNQIENLYSQALKEIDAGNLEVARGLLSQLKEMEPGYAESERLLAKVEAEIERQAEERQRLEQVTALYRQAQSLARAGQWLQVLSKMEALRQSAPGYADSEDLFANAQRQVELARQEGRRQEELAAIYAEAVQLLELGDYQKAVDKIAAIGEIDPNYPDREKVRQRALEKLVKPVKEAGARQWKPLSYLREHIWLNVTVITFIVMLALLAWFSSNYNRLFPPAVPPGASSAPSTGPIEAAGPIGGQVSVLVGWQGPELQNFQDVLAAFQDRTGVEVNVESSPDFDVLLTTQVNSGDPPDLAVLAGPTYLMQFAQQGKLVDMSGILEKSAYNSQYSKAWSDLGTVDGKLVGVFIRASMKGMIWYDPKVWQANGLQIPVTWDDLMSLSDQIANSGSYPWCVALESGDVSGWPGTDWLEDIVLRKSGENIYNAWWQGNLAWTSPEIRQAWEAWGRIVADPRMAFGGAIKMLTTHFTEVGNGLFTSPPNCYMVHQGSFIAGFFQDNNPGVMPINDFDFFNFPNFTEGAPERTVISGDLISMFNDTPQSEALINYLVSQEAQETWVKQGGAISPSKSVSINTYSDLLSRKVAERLTGTDVAVFDASDLMPPELNNEYFYGGYGLRRRPSKSGCNLTTVRGYSPEYQMITRGSSIVIESA